jgi:hypothetical protein
MYLSKTKKPRKTNRKKCARNRAKIKAKNKRRQDRIYQRDKK